MKEEEKLGIIRQLFQMTQADGEVKPVEYSFLYELALSMGVPLEKLEEIFEIESQYQIPKEQVNRIIQIYRLALIMKVDKHTADSEIKTLKTMAIQMGLRSDAVDNMLNKMKEKDSGTLNFEELMEIFNVQKN
jgi:uncharacterized tellurite resistance protein B-like protein